MGGEEIFEQCRAGGEGAQSIPAQARPSTQEQQESTHQGGTPHQTAMGFLIVGQIVALESFSQGERLAKGETETFSSDGIDGTGCIANEGDVATSDMAKPASRSDRAHFGGTGQSSEARTELWELGEGVL
jgi:hypothetical protein